MMTPSVNDFLKTPAGLRALLGSCDRESWKYYPITKAINAFTKRAEPTYVMMKMHPLLPEVPIFVYAPVMRDPLRTRLIDKYTRKPLSDKYWTSRLYDIAMAVALCEFS